MPATPRSTMRRDIVSAYVVTISRIGSWALVSALVYRLLGAGEFALLALVRATIGLFSYISLGIGPALVRVVNTNPSAPAQAVIPIPEASNVLEYAGPARPDYITRAYFSAERVVLLLGLVGFALAMTYSIFFPSLHFVSAHVETGEAIALTMLFSAGIVCRVTSEAPSGLLLSVGRIAVDNYLLAATELIWATGCAITFSIKGSSRDGLILIGVWFWLAATFLYAARVFVARREVRRLSHAKAPIDWRIARQLLGIGSLIVLAQLADFLYAPTDCILINRLISPEAVAWYSPAMQIDAGLLLFVTGVATVLYPKTAIAHGAGDVALIRRYYIRGTLASGAILILAALAVWAISPWLFKFWFGDDLPMTRAILPLMLIHTVVGGSSAVGRSILLGIGKFKAFTISVLIAGVGNVLLSYIFVRYFDLGLKGIVLGTIIAVAGQCAIWMPWYISRTLRGGDATQLKIDN